MEPSQVTLDASLRFYTTHNLADWGDALPAAADLSNDRHDSLAQAAKHGFTSAFAFPPFAVQMESLSRLIDETARKPAPVPDNQQYREPFLADDWSRIANGKVLQRTDDLGPREWGAYLLLFSPDPQPKAWGLTGKQIREHFQAKDWYGLTVPEYLVLQRRLCERFGDHRFFEIPEDDSGAHSMWLIDSMDDKNCSVAVGGNRGINIQAAGINNRDRKRATIAAMIAPL
jgi:hypothetical protein